MSQASTRYYRDLARMLADSTACAEWHHVELSDLRDIAATTLSCALATLETLTTTELAGYLVDAGISSPEFLNA